MDRDDRRRLAELAGLFLKLGTIAVGGPAAHVALMRSEVVGRRRWLDDREFLDLVGATALVPGPNSTELAIWLGQRRAGWRGLLVAGMCFILPAALLAVLLAELYLRHGTTPVFADLRYGLLPVVVAVVAHAVWVLGRTAARTVPLAALALAAATLRVVGVDELLILVLGAVIALAAAQRRHLGGSAVVLLPFGLAVAPAEEVGLLRLLLVFLKFGSVVFGSGYVLIAFLEHDLVDRLHWLTRQELFDAVAVGQVTPGPVFTTATFIGYLLRGTPGAVVATVGIFLPSFLLVALLARGLPVLLRSPWARPLLDGVNATAVGLMAAVAVELADAALVDPWTLALALGALAVLLRTGLNATWLLAVGALAGALHAVST